MISPLVGCDLNSDEQTEENEPSTAYGDWVANIFDGNDIQASGTDWTAHGAVTKAHARYLYLHQDSAPIDPLIALFRDSNR